MVYHFYNLFQPLINRIKQQKKYNNSLEQLFAVILLTELDQNPIDYSTF